MTLGYAKITQEKVHLDHSQAMKKLNDAQIPLFISEKKGGIDESLKDIHGFIQKSWTKQSLQSGKRN